MKILLFGKNGQVGWELCRSLQPLGEVIALGREDVDFSNPESLRKVVDETQPEIIVNAVAYTAVDKAESDEELATTINGLAPGVLAEEALKCNALLVHYSTDYVFDGAKAGPYKETDEPNPINVYGHSKLLGEKKITESGCKYLIFRTSWVFARRGHNFVKTILQLAKEREDLKVVADQVGSPTSAELIADVTALSIYLIAYGVISLDQGVGIYHLTASDKTSWHGLAAYLVNVAHDYGTALRARHDSVLPIATSDYAFEASRPANSQLDCEKLSSVFGVDLPHWGTHVTRSVIEMLELEREIEACKK